jgi:hypothetical protein
MKRFMAVFIVLFLIVTTLGCSQFIIWDNDKFPVKAAKFTSRLIIGIPTFACSEMFIEEAKIKHNKKIINALWEQYYVATNEIEQQRLLRQIYDIEQTNMEIKEGLRAFGEAMQRSADRAAYQRAMRQQQNVNCTCMDLGGGIVNCNCR